ncbi:MAG: beta-propeller fold lactonase family protein [Rhodospirillaceae bacterium]|nr:beta-propeller fold lactonase family protein [Rhodospirillaceae bacterium]
MTACTFLASVGPRLIRYSADAEAATLGEVDEINLGLNLQYAWPHPARHLLYAVISNGGPGVPGDQHALVTLVSDPETGEFCQTGKPIALPHRPIHLTLDGDARHLLVAYVVPSHIEVWRLGADGVVGDPVAQPNIHDVGIFGHQIRVLPSGGAAVLVTRGNPGSDVRPEDPGALKLFNYSDGVLKDQKSVAPNDGFGFGPRHLDFHPSEPWALVSIERQNQLQLFQMTGDSFAEEASFVASTLEHPTAATPRQHGGAIHVHPNGCFVYVSNRSDEADTVDGREVFAGGENAIAVFSLDPRTGEPTRIQNAPSLGFVPRTFSIDPSGKLLIAANQNRMDVRDGAGFDTVPASLVLYRIGDDGRLELAHRHSVETGSDTQFWSGFLPW